jgi:hypothetical protein
MFNIFIRFSYQSARFKIGIVQLKKILIFASLASLAACAVEKTPVPTGGSKSDGLVELSYQVGALEVPTVNWAAAQKSATKRCNSWGYRQADPFEGVKQQCVSSDIYGGCNMMTVTRVYQCTN